VRKEVNCAEAAHVVFTTLYYFPFLRKESMLIRIIMLC
jgi:hypothetical protein